MAIRPWLWLAVPVLGALELVMHVVFAARAPGSADFEGTLADLDRMRREGDLLVIAPEWAEPLARKAYGDERLTLGMIARMDASSYPAAIEVSALGMRASELASFKEVQALQSGRLWLRRLENTTYEPVLYPFIDRVSPEHLAVGEWNGEAERDCEFSRRTEPRPLSQPGVSNSGIALAMPQPNQRFICAGQQAAMVGVTLFRGGAPRPRRCIFAPAPLNGVLRLRFARVPVGRALRGYVARPEPAPSRALASKHLAFSAYVAGQRVGREAIAVSPKFQRFDFKLNSDATAAEVVFEVEAEQGASRDFCFVAEMR